MRAWPPQGPATRSAVPGCAEIKSVWQYVWDPVLFKRIEFCDADDETFVFDIFCGQSAKLFLDAAALYRCMSEQLGWSEEKFFDQYKGDDEGRG
jgi:hypothetical protein